MTTASTGADARERLLASGADLVLLDLRLPDIEASGEPVQTVSRFVNGIKQLPCTFTPVAPLVRSA